MFSKSPLFIPKFSSTRERVATRFLGKTPNLQWVGKWHDENIKVTPVPGALTRHLEALGFARHMPIPMV